MSNFQPIGPLVADIVAKAAAKAAKDEQVPQWMKDLAKSARDYTPGIEGWVKKD